MKWNQAVLLPYSLKFSFDAESSPQVDSRFSEIMVNRFSGVSKKKLKKLGFLRWKIRITQQGMPKLNEMLKNVLNNPKATNKDFGEYGYARETVRAGRVLESRIVRAVFMLMKNPSLNNKEFKKKGLSKPVVRKAKALIDQVEKIPEEKIWNKEYLKNKGYSGRAIDWAWDIAFLTKKGQNYVPSTNLYPQGLVEYARKQCLEPENEVTESDGLCDKVYQKLDDIAGKFLRGMAKI